MTAAPDVAWVDGVGAASALSALTEFGDLDIATRDEWLEARRSAPVTAAFGGLLVAAAAVILALAILVVGLVSAAGARGRAYALAGFRVLGLPAAMLTGSRSARRSSPVVTAAVVGTATGAFLAVVARWPAGPRGADRATRDADARHSRGGAGYRSPPWSRGARGGCGGVGRAPARATRAGDARG